MNATAAPRNGSMKYVALQLQTACRLPTYHDNDRTAWTNAPSAPANNTISSRRSSSYIQKHCLKYLTAPTPFLGMPFSSRQNPSLIDAAFSQSVSATVGPPGPGLGVGVGVVAAVAVGEGEGEDRKSTRLNSSHLVISYAI